GEPACGGVEDPARTVIARPNRNNHDRDFRDFLALNTAFMPFVNSAASKGCMYVAAAPRRLAVLQYTWLISLFPEATPTMGGDCSRSWAARSSSSASSLAMVTPAMMMSASSRIMALRAATPFSTSDMTYLESLNAVRQAALSLGLPLTSS